MSSPPDKTDNGNPRMPSVDPSCVRADLGLGLRLCTVRSLAEALGLEGVSERHIRHLLRSLNIPILHIGPNQFVDFAEFVITLKAALTSGCDDLYIPVPRPNSRRPYSVPRDCRYRTSIPPGSVASALPEICRRILASREISGAPSQSVSSVRTWLATASDRILMEAGRSAAPIPVPKTRRRRPTLSDLMENPPDA